jgi:hypothetical protein
MLLHRRRIRVIGWWRRRIVVIICGCGVPSTLRLRIGWRMVAVVRYSWVHQSQSSYRLSGPLGN